jgi:hypothetical protein
MMSPRLTRMILALLAIVVIASLILSTLQY